MNVRSDPDEAVAGSVWWGKWPASSKISSSLPGIAAWVRRPCPSGMIASRRPHTMENRKHTLGQVGPVQHRDHLALPGDARARGYAGWPGARLGVGRCVERGQDLLGVAPERGVEHAQHTRRRAGWRSG